MTAAYLLVGLLVGLPATLAVNRQFRPRPEPAWQSGDGLTLAALCLLWPLVVVVAPIFYLLGRRNG